MRHILTLNPTTASALNKAAAHRTMALAALHADSSVSVRLRRYNAHIAKARVLESAVLDDKYPVRATQRKA